MQALAGNVMAAEGFTSGWVKVPRSILNSPIWGDATCLQILLYLKLNANIRPRRTVNGVVIPRGALLTGRSQLARECHTTEQVVRTCLKHLESTGWITTKSTNHGTMVTVTNYDVSDEFDGIYQPADQPANQPAANQQLTTLEEGKKEKRVCVQGSKVVQITTQRTGAPTQSSNEQLPDDVEARVRAMADKYPRNEGYENGCRDMMQLLLSAVHPVQMLAAFETNVPRWINEIVYFRTRCKPWVWFIRDRDWERAPKTEICTPRPKEVDPHEP